MRKLIRLIAALALVAATLTLASGCCKFRSATGDAPPRCSVGG